MKNKQDTGTLEKPSLTRPSVYFPMLGYAVVALLIRAFAWSPIAVLLITPVGWEIKWVAFLCPVIFVILVWPMRFSFARAMMATAKGKPFSIGQALRLTQYRKKLSAALKHALRMLLWAVPLLLALGGLYYAYQMKVPDMMRTIAAFGKGAAAAISGVHNFFTGIFGGGRLQLDYDFPEGVLVVAGIVAFTVLVLIFGAWRCSVYRYLWAYQVTRTNGSAVKCRPVLRGYRWKQVCYGLYNFFLWLPTLFVVFLLVLSMQVDVSDISSMLFGPATLNPFAVTTGEIVLAVFGLLLHLLLLPVRRSMTAGFVYAVLQDYKKEG